MRALIEFAELDLRGAFDFAIMIEEDAQSRYAALARRLANDPGGAGEIFRQMVAMEGTHRSVLVQRRAALFAGEAPRVEISVADDAVEGPVVDDDDLPTTAHAALRIAIDAERRARAFYAAVAPTAKDPEVRAFLEQLMREEEAHAALLERRLAALGEPDPREAPPPRTAASRSAPTFPDRDALREALPRFDAATQAVAASVVVHGLAEAQVAEALGVSRRTVSRKLSAFLVIARRGVAVAAAAATLAGSARAMPPADATLQTVTGTYGPPRASVEQTRTAPAARAPRKPPRDELASRILAQVASRMSRHDAAVHGRIARTILAEAKEARLDPLLVLALIHVESSFDPLAVSSAGAAGLMQLLEPTMRAELERWKLPLADPTDPVANVKAGVRYLKRLIDAFEGDTDVALMAYNAGPNRIRGHLRRGGIPERFHEYPRRVNRELERLRAALGAQPASPMMAQADTPPRPRS
jgi:soluble lytic murein transglycosylase-like protein